MPLVCDETDWCGPLDNFWIGREITPTVLPSDGPWDAQQTNLWRSWPDLARQMIVNYVFVTSFAILRSSNTMSKRCTK